MTAAALALAAFVVFVSALGSGQAGREAELRMEIAQEYVLLYAHTLELSGRALLGDREVDVGAAWEVVSGPGEVELSGAGTRVDARFSAPGTYMLRATVRADGRVASKDIKVEVVTPEATYYVSPDGDDSNDGRAIDAPFRTIRKAASVVRAGDVVMLRGGVYYEYNRVGAWTRTGEPGAPITFMSYPGERAIIDGSRRERSDHERNAATPELIKIVDLDWYVFDGLVFRNSAGRGLELRGDHHVVRNVVSHSNHSDGIFLRGDHNLVSDSASFDNYSRSNGGESADGVKIDFGEGNVVRRVIAYANSDDGFDLWGTTGSLIEHSAAFENGRGENGDGNGFKMSSAGVDSGNVIRFNVAYSNRRNNFDDNGGGGLEVYNNTSFDAGMYGFVLRGREGRDRSSAYNNISYRDAEGVLIDVLSRRAEPPDSRSNSWDLRIGDPGFVSTDPESRDFLRLSPDSRAVDAGVDVGVEYSGAAKDLGAFEFSLAARAGAE